MSNLTKKNLNICLLEKIFFLYTVVFPKCIDFLSWGDLLESVLVFV